MTRELVRSLLPSRRADGHKGDFGRVYAVAGSVGYTGAPVYAAEAAARTGSGLVFVGVPEEVYPIVAARCATAMAQPLPKDREELLERLNRCDAGGAGAGPGRLPQTEELVVFLLERLEKPVILDADGINAAAAHIHVLRNRRPAHGGPRPMRGSSSAWGAIFPWAGNRPLLQRPGHWAA